MKKFIINLCIYLLVFALSGIIIIVIDRYIISNQYMGNYQASILDKVERLKSINEPKIILVGNSNLAFGIDSEKIEKEIGRPVVNLGLHGGLGNPFHEDMAKFNINEGDIVIDCPTAYNSDGVQQYNLFWITIEHHDELYSLIRKEDYLSLLKAYPSYLLKSITLWITKDGNKENNSTYSRKAFNKYGDVVVKPKNEETKDKLPFTRSSAPIISDKCVKRLNEYNEYINDKGATLLIASYPIAYGEYMASKEKFDKFEDELKSKVSCDVISHFTDYFIPYEYFYNTKFHLTEEGATIRTDLLIKDIKKWLEQQKGEYKS